MENTKSPFESLRDWVRNSVTLKLASITILVLILLIPTSMIQSIISEREYLQERTVREVSSKWANEQYLSGPILTIPVEFVQVKEKETIKHVRYAHFLPEQLAFNGVINPESLRRGIYEVVVYKSDLRVSGQFSISDQLDAQEYHRILWEDAFLTFGISDLRGIEEQIEIDWNGVLLTVEPGSKINGVINSGITVKLPAVKPDSVEKASFQFDLKLQGSSNMSFMPLGSETSVQLESKWPAPSFDGAFLPDERELDENGFTASWRVLELNRNYPQHWFGDQYGSEIGQSRFGVNLLLPLDDYQKTMRSAKYAIMTIALTFLVFFLVEVMTRRKIHPFQYTLVGLALSLFYVLLLSISEHLNFNTAYLYASLAVMAMVGLYSVGVFKETKYSLMLLLVLGGVYGFLFVILQLADYALLMGSIGLTIILGLTMYFTRNIDWYTIASRNRA